MSVVVNSVDTTTPPLTVPMLLVEKLPTLVLLATFPRGTTHTSGMGLAELMAYSVDPMGRSENTETSPDGGVAVKYRRRCGAQAGLVELAVRAEQDRSTIYVCAGSEAQI